MPTCFAAQAWQGRNASIQACQASLLLLQAGIVLGQHDQPGCRVQGQQSPCVASLQSACLHMAPDLCPAIQLHE